MTRVVVFKCESFDYFFFQAEDGIRDYKVTGVQTCALPISVVRNPHHGTVPFGGDSNRELRLPGRVREAVVDQVVEDASQLLLIRVDRHGLGRQDRRNLGSEKVGSGTRPLAGVLDDCAEVELVMVSR